MKTVVLLLLGMMTGFVLAVLPLYAGDPSSPGTWSHDEYEIYDSGFFDGQRAAEQRDSARWSNSYGSTRNPC